MSQIHEANNHEGTKENHSIMYYNILSKISNQINWLTFVILIIVGISIFILYAWHFGNLKYAIEREKYIQAHPKEVVDKIKSNPENADQELIENPEEIKNRAEENVKEFKKMEAECRIAFLRFAGVKVFITDFLILLSIVGTLFLVWLYFLFKYSKNTMVELFNFPSIKTSVQELGISSLFFVITHGFGKRRYLTVFEMLASTFLLLTSLEFISNLWDLFFQKTEYGITGLYYLPGFEKFFPHALVSTSLIFCCMIAIYVVRKKTEKILIDIHNLILLLKWVRVAIVPTLFSLIEKKLNQKLDQGQNSIEYIYSEERRGYKLMITLSITKSESAKNQLHLIEGGINLRKSLGKYLKTKTFSEAKNAEIDKYLNRRLMKTELKMREFFYTIFTDDTLENEIATDFIKVAEKFKNNTCYPIRRRIFSRNRRGLRQRIQ